MSEPIMIGVDHGYAAMKTTHCTFPTGLVEYEHEPYTRKGVLEYGGKFYVVGSGRQPLQKRQNPDRGLLPSDPCGHRHGDGLSGNKWYGRYPFGSRLAPD